jgi:hypothetical protein
MTQRIGLLIWSDIGGSSLKKGIDISNEEDLNYIMSIIEQSYKDIL